ncbi:MAG: ribonuclease III domain-containing protein [Bryobacterales bacterium]|nr:ribonuclease III domain-containing protein [Bryobacterales bacterium]
MPCDETLERLQREAWIGDAVLTLFARTRILATENRVDAELAAAMTSNQFLSAFGDPTSAEAELGRVYEEYGLTYAFDWIDAQWMPLFRRQRERRLRGKGMAGPSKSKGAMRAKEEFR